MTTIATQETIDHINAAQQRVASDTGLLQKRATITVPAGSASVTLPAEVIEIQAVFSGANEVPVIPVVDYMRLVTGNDATTIQDLTTNTFFIVVSRSLYIWPTSAAATSLTAYYTYRPEQMTSETSLELQGGAKRLVERLSSAYFLFDDGQPELGQTELASYQKDATRLSKRNRAALGGGGQFRILGRPGRRGR